MQKAAGDKSNVKIKTEKRIWVTQKDLKELPSFFDISRQIWPQYSSWLLTQRSHFFGFFPLYSLSPLSPPSFSIPTLLSPSYSPSPFPLSLSVSVPVSYILSLTDVANVFLFRNNSYAATVTARWTGNAKVRPFGFLPLHFGSVAFLALSSPVSSCSHGVPRSRVNYATRERKRNRGRRKRRVGRAGDGSLGIYK